MFYSDGKLQYPVRVDRPDPLFARALQQAIGGVEGEIRVAMQYFFQAMGARGPKKYRDMLLNTATEELGHIEMLATAVALNLEGAPSSLQEEAAKDRVVNAALGGMNLKHLLSAGLPPTPCDLVRRAAGGVAAASQMARDGRERGSKSLTTSNRTSFTLLPSHWAAICSGSTLDQSQLFQAINAFHSWLVGRPSCDGRGRRLVGSLAHR